MAVRFRLNGHFLSGPTYKVGLMLTLSGEPFAFKMVNLMAGEHRGPDYLAKARFGQIPCLEDLQNGRRLVQSAAILDYLADRLGRFGGASYDERLEAREWMFWDFDRLAAPFYRTRMIAIGFAKVHEEVAADVRRVAEAGIATLERHLAGRDWLVGDHPTIADLDVYGVLAFAGEAKIDLSAWPAVAAFVARVEALPNFGRPADVLPKADRPA
ncbi:glutathione S-transferase family protein [Oharaeibacter diazotrophicus]|uniref:Glutathione S-transferase n=1 Tax=Oharaeibacter diazotrophicus TaxID=1920512 RepID=A0A4R6RIX4_9HYPH|nr:glutathione S-transferase family protein [Oharaeibacter diazotrophicus]TDP86443.1 glutathione S-transferase [Oharaeibacter diazotrophicus]BBE71615.1 glutathione S-transferase GST-4.5 [Pleomorphomonas sp. SM30]GLS78377.1 glutathione S-transferase [Oharaeibacter diazotrophicus]